MISGQTLKYVGLPSADWVNKKHSDENLFLMLIPEKKFLVANILS